MPSLHANAWLLLVALSASGSDAAEIAFIAEAPDFAIAADEYRTIWLTDGDRIADALARHTGLRLESKPISAIVYEGVSWSGDDVTPMRLRASYTRDTKRATLVHELSHRLIAGLVSDGAEDHPIIFLFVYDVWVDLWGEDFASAQVVVESSRKGIYDYEDAWRIALSYGATERAKRWAQFVSDRRAKMAP